MKYYLLQLAQTISTSDVPALPTLSGEQILLNTLNIVYFLAGIIAVVVIIVGGFTYATSGGNPAGVTKGKNMLLFAVIGLVVVFAAFAITNFVFGRFGI